jgi:hypothetical protein
MSALQWHQCGRDTRTADGSDGAWYELRREHTNAGTWWTAWFDDGSLYPAQRIGQGNFTQCRAACIRHYNTPGA